MISYHDISICTADIFSKCQQRLHFMRVLNYFGINNRVEWGKMEHGARRNTFHFIRYYGSIFMLILPNSSLYNGMEYEINIILLSTMFMLTLCWKSYLPRALL